MKNPRISKKHILAIAVTAAGFALIAGSAKAALIPLNWDPLLSGTGSDGAGTWDAGVTSNWSTGAGGSPANTDTTWTNANGVNSAIFGVGGAGGSVNVVPPG